MSGLVESRCLGDSVLAHGDQARGPSGVARRQEELDAAVTGEETNGRRHRLCSGADEAEVHPQATSGRLGKVSAVRSKDHANAGCSADETTY